MSSIGQWPKRSGGGSGTVESVNHVLPVAGDVEIKTTDLPDMPSSPSAGEDGYFLAWDNDTEEYILVAGGGGATAFTDLSDVPGSYAVADALKTVRVNAAHNGLEFHAMTATDVGADPAGAAAAAYAAAVAVAAADATNKANAAETAAKNASLPVGGTAADADKLDGHDSTYFVASTDARINSILLFVGSTSTGLPSAAPLLISGSTVSFAGSPTITWYVRLKTASGTAYAVLYDKTTSTTVYTLSTAATDFATLSHSVTLTSGHEYEIRVYLTGGSVSTDKATITASWLTLTY